MPFRTKLKLFPSFACKLPEFGLTLLPVELETKNYHIMGKKNRNRVTHTQREEEQGKKVIRTMVVIAIILVIIMLVAYTVWA